MLLMNVRHVDPRDQAAELDDPAYRVYFWSRDRNTALPDGQ